MKTPLRLYHYWRSSSSWRVRWALAIKGLPCEFVPVNLLSDEPESPEHLRRNPLGFVPVLEVGGKLLGESMAILHWLEESHPTPSLLPSDFWQRARARQLAEIINADIQPVQNLNVLDQLSSDPARRKEWAQFWIRRGLKAYESLVRETAGKFSLGDEITLPDLFLIPQCYNAARFDIDIPTEFPLIGKIQSEALRTEACRRSHPDAFQPSS